MTSITNSEMLHTKRKSISFENMIAPLSTKVFFEEFYEKKVLRIHRDTPNYFKHLLSYKRLDQLFCEHQLFMPDTRMVNAKDDLDPETYAINGRIDTCKMLKRFHEGSTIVLSGLHDRIPELGRLCDTMMSFFSHRFQTNIYMTPGNAQGFKIHYDSHDVFVMQVEGSKKWRLYDTPIDLPTKMLAFKPGEFDPGEATAEFTLHAGDMLYIPRGIMHEAVSTDETSLHITGGLTGFTWADFMIDAVLNMSKTNVAFRKFLPVGFAHNDHVMAPTKETFQTLLKTMMAEFECSDSYDRFSKDLCNHMKTNVPDQLSQIQAIHEVNGNTIVERQAFIDFKIANTTEECMICFNGQEIKFPAFTSETIDYFNRHLSFRVGDMPDCMDEQGNVVFVQRLIKEGLLRQANLT